MSGHLLPALAALALATQARRVAVAPAETLAVEVQGSGPAVVMVPGLFGNAWSYRGVTARLAADGLRVVVIEPLAIGSSSRPRAADYSLTAQAGRLAAALDSLGERDAVVVAHSLGAGMAFRLALRRPDLVRAVVSLDGGASESAASPGFRRAMAFAPLLRLFGGRHLVRGRIRASLVGASGDAAWVTDEAIARYTGPALADLDGTLLAFLAMAQARERMLLAPRIHELRAPVWLVIGGAAHPERVSAREEAQLRGAIASLTVETVPGAGHYLHEERPDIVADVVRRALTTRVAAASP